MSIKKLTNSDDPWKHDVAMQKAEAALAEAKRGRAEIAANWAPLNALVEEIKNASDEAIELLARRLTN